MSEQFRRSQVQGNIGVPKQGSERQDQPMQLSGQWDLEQQKGDGTTPFASLPYSLDVMYVIYSTFVATFAKASDFRWPETLLRIVILS